MSHWKKRVEPYASVWTRVLEHALGRGLVHGQFALDALHDVVRGRVSVGPVDAADLLADMVGARELVPCKLDVAGASFSVRAFRHAGPSAGGRPSSSWRRVEAHLWTYTANRSQSEPSE